MSTNLTRRQAFAGAAALLTGCSRPLAKRYHGWLLAAGAADRVIAVADLSNFRRVGSIPVGEVPGQILRVGNRVFVTCPDARLLVEVLMDRFSAGARLPMPGRIVGASVAATGNIVVATTQPDAVVVVDAIRGKILRRIPLDADPLAFDVFEDRVAVATAGEILRFSTTQGTLLGRTKLSEPPGSLFFRKDGKSLLVGLGKSRQIVSLDGATGAILARLPLPFEPGRFCFNADGGQMFVTAEGEDSLAIVSPYQSQIDQTILGGRMPWGMAVSAARNMLLMTNPPSGDLTILDIETRRIAASVHIGGEPGEVLLTLDEEYALVLNRDAGDAAVIRMKTALDRTIRTKPILTMIQMGARPQSAMILPQQA